MEDIKEKTANELFSELGYIKKRRGIEELVCYCSYKKNKPIQEIFFNKEAYCFCIYPFGNEAIATISMEELQAINKKCQELRLVRR